MRIISGSDLQLTSAAVLFTTTGFKKKFFLNELGSYITLKETLICKDVR